MQCVQQKLKQYGGATETEISFFFCSSEDESISLVANINTYYTTNICVMFRKSMCACKRRSFTNRLSSFGRQ